VKEYSLSLYSLLLYKKQILLDIKLVRIPILPPLKCSMQIKYNQTSTRYKNITNYYKALQLEWCWQQKYKYNKNPQFDVNTARSSLVQLVLASDIHTPVTKHVDTCYLTQKPHIYIAKWTDKIKSFGTILWQNIMHTGMFQVTQTPSPTSHWYMYYWVLS